MKRGAIVACVLVTLAALSVAAQDQAPVDTFDAAWKIVRDTHFDPRMNGVDWNAVSTELRPRALAASSPGELRSVIREMLGRLGQSHFVLLPSGADSPRDVPVDAGGDPGFDVRLVGPRDPGDFGGPGGRGSLRRSSNGLEGPARSTAQLSHRFWRSSIRALPNVC